MQLGQALGVSDSAIGAWEKKGCPVMRRGRGQGRKSLYDFDAVKRWCDETGHASGINALSAARIVATAPAPQPASDSRLARAVLSAVSSWVSDAADSGYLDAIDAADLADLGELFTRKIAQALSHSPWARAGQMIGASLDADRERPKDASAASAIFDKARNRISTED